MNPFLYLLFYRTPLFYLIQSIWRDEAFSYLLAHTSVGTIILSTAQDFNPPFYYLLLHYWIFLVGHSDSGLRLLSFLFHLGTVYFSFLLGRRYFSLRFAWFLAAFTFFNPTLLYYAFEMRMYALYALCTIASFYFLLQKNWRGYTIACALGLYTHSFFLFLPLAYSVTMMGIERKERIPQLRLLLQPFIFYLPWIPVLAAQFAQSQDSWIFPVTRQGVLSALGNLFIAYEGTPDGLWPHTQVLSGVILLFCFLALRKRNAVTTQLLLPLLGPLCFILLYSVTFRSLYVNRYLIPVTVFEVLGIGAGIAALPYSWLRRLCAAMWLIAILIINDKALSFHQKVDFKTTFREINTHARPTDYVYSQTPLGFLESAYYYAYPDHVFVYNPTNNRIPNYIGVTVLFPTASQVALPPAPSTTYVVADDATYEVVVHN